MKTDQLRKLYLDYFAERGHKVLPSASLLPNDPTLLFTSAGMVQFKDIFWGRVDPPFPKATTCQKCFRATDIEKVGKTAFHHTFFEMLGNFAFGDYFKEGAIKLAWEFVTRELSIPKEQLWASVYEDDDEAYTIWRDVIGLPPERIVRLGKEHNWWGPVGKTGPCGPDSEIFYDAGADKACGPDCHGVTCDCNRFSEIWNLVFMQYEAKEDGSFVPLKRKNIDTGMGLERTAAVLQGVTSDFEIDLFRPIVEAIEKAMPREATPEALAPRNIVADHIRGIVFLLADGVVPANEKRGYVLRRILRRAIRAGERLDLPDGALKKLVDPVIASLGKTYPEIVSTHALSERVIAHEEETFRKTLRSGERRLQEILDDLVARGEKTLPGEIAFELYDTDGLPLKMTEEIAAEQGIVIDKDGFQKEMARQRKRSRTITASVKADTILVRAGEENPTQFVGYEKTRTEGKIRGFYPGDPDRAELVFDQSPFYAEAGGQIADTGRIENLSQPGRAKVLDVQENPQGAFLHHVLVADGTFAVGDRCRLIVDAERRRHIARNHTATHILHRALREVLGEHVVQAGSLVSGEELRFDFSHFEKVTGEEIVRVENLANSVVLADLPLGTEEMPLDKAKESGAMAHFEEEYRGKNVVRVVSVEDFSRELCGGTHVSRTGEIGLIKIISEESVAAGTRRIRAVSGEGALTRWRATEGLLDQLRVKLGKEPLDGLGHLHDELELLRNRLARMTEEILQGRRDELLARGERVDAVTLVSGRLDMGAEQIKHLADLLEKKARPAVVLVVGKTDDSGIAICKVSRNVTGVDAGEIIRAAAASLGGGGGGDRHFAQGGGTNFKKLDQALASGNELARASLAPEDSDYSTGQGEE